MTLLRYPLLRMLLASAMGGVVWGSRAAIGATIENPIADQGRRLLEQAAAPALALDALKALPGAAADAITQAGGHFGDAVRGLADAGPADGPGRIHGRIVRVADGDTITVRSGAGEKVKVRLLGIDAPESTTLRRGHAECGGQEAKALMRHLAAEHPRYKAARAGECSGNACRAKIRRHSCVAAPASADTDVAVTCTRKNKTVVATD